MRPPCLAWLRACEASYVDLDTLAVFPQQHACVRKQNALHGVRRRVACMHAPLAHLQAPPSLACMQECIALVDRLFQRELDLLFGQHLSRGVSCCIFATSRLHNVVVAIKVIIGVALDPLAHVELHAAWA